MKNLVNNAKKSFSSHQFTIKDINPNLIQAQYAVRGPIVNRAMEIQEQINRKAKGEQGLPDYPFTELTEANIGNPQTFGQPPFSFHREVLAGILYPELVKSGKITNKDVKDRVEYYLSNIPGNIGAYTVSYGYVFARQSVANFIKERDGLKEDIDLKNIFMLGGASEGVNMVLSGLISSKSDGVMIPIPQYPLYSAVISLCGGSQCNYYMNEEEKWSINIDELERSHKESVAKGVTPKVLVVINPGNPTGTLITRQNLEKMVKFAYEKKMILIADEVYQTNIYTGDKFVSCRKVLAEMPAPYNQTQVVSLHSTSKGVIGECGIRGGYMELANLDPEVHAQLFKMKSINLCSNSVGQIMTELMVNPPREGQGYTQETIDKYQSEWNNNFNGLRDRSKIITESLNKMVNIHSQPSEAAMYAFPSIKFSQKVLDEAKKRNQPADMYFCMSLLEKTGIVTVPGSGFGQKDGTYHFRTTNLIQPASKMAEKMGELDKFNTFFHNEHK